jgi:hypothetical protein
VEEVVFVEFCAFKVLATNAHFSLDKRKMPSRKHMHLNIARSLERRSREETAGPRRERCTMKKNIVACYQVTSGQLQLSIRYLSSLVLYHKGLCIHTFQYSPFM